ncbi:hypothetical protein HDU67_006939 [Dinochytrium kinnereticum]|nr:hypothetical protein HDU67_006939 [Dinochytrium kinnereticum]
MSDEEQALLERLPNDPLEDNSDDEDHLWEDDDDDIEQPLEFIPRLRRPLLEIIKKHLRPTSVFAAILLFLIAVPTVWLLLRRSLTMPSRVLSLDETIQTGAFSGEAAWNHLKIISEETHMYNSDYNLKVRQFLVDVLGEFQSLAASQGRADTIEIAKDNINITDNWRRIQYYESNNVIVRIRGESPQRDALLISSHFDSTAVSKGVGDSGIAISVMLELVRTLIYNPRLSHDVILLFNNGEEMGLLGATAFVRHSWFPDVRGFINLEGTGAAPGSRSILFRTNSFELMKEWKRNAPYPHASVLFNNLMVLTRSDTDYRPYATLGHLEGIDIAFYTDRYLYHTPKDDFNHSLPLSAQQLGENVKALTIAICNSDTLQKLNRIPESPNRDDFPPSPNFVYYDFFSSFILTRGATYKGILSLMLIIVILLAVVKLSVEFTKLGPRRLFHLYVKPTLESYLLIILTVTVTLVSTILLSLFKVYWNKSSTYGRPLLNFSWILSWVFMCFAFIQLVWPRIALKLHFRSRRIEIATLGGGTERRDVKGLPIEKWLPYGLLGFWITLLLVALYASFYMFYGVFFLSDWAFFSLLSVGLTQAIAPLIIKWWKYEVVNSDLSVWKTKVVKFYEKHIWVIQLLIASAIPSLLTIEVLEQILVCLPTLGGEGLPETLIDFAFEQIWDVSDALKANISQVSVTAFPSISDRSCANWVCTYSEVSTPVLPGNVKWNSTISITLTENDDRAVREMPIGTRKEKGEMIEVAGSFIGSPGSRICSLQVIYPNASSNRSSVWIDPEAMWRWQTADKGLIPQPRNSSWARWGNFEHPILIFKRDFNHAEERIKVPFLIRYSKEDVRQSSYLTLGVNCYHTETKTSPFWKRVSEGLPDWVLQSHGRYLMLLIFRVSY